MAYYGGFNHFTGEAQLVPIHLQFGMSSSLEAYIGYLDHLRLIRITYYNIGDVITIGSDSWMVFPWGLKNTDTPNGPPTQGFHTTGTLGFAVRYVP